MICIKKARRACSTYVPGSCPELYSGLSIDLAKKGSDSPVTCHKENLFILVLGLVLQKSNTVPGSRRVKKTQTRQVSSLSGFIKTKFYINFQPNRDPMVFLYDYIRTE